MRKIFDLSYSELIRIPTFDERFDYLSQIKGRVGEDTFGGRRWLNQQFYSSREWKTIRDFVICRDLGCDLAVANNEIVGGIYIHHINPITPESFLNKDKMLLDPNNLVCCSFSTHNAIHYGSKENLQRDITERTRNDTCPWRK